MPEREEKEQEIEHLFLFTTGEMCILGSERHGEVSHQRSSEESPEESILGREQTFKAENCAGASLLLHEMWATYSQLNEDYGAEICYVKICNIRKK